MQRPDVQSDGADDASVVVRVGHFGTDDVVWHCALLATHNNVVLDCSATLKFLAVPVVNHFAKGTFRVEEDLVFEELPTVVVGCDGFNVAVCCFSNS